MAEPVPYTPDLEDEEEAVVQRIRAQQAGFAELDREPRPDVPGPVTVDVHGERFVVPLTVGDVRAALSAELRPLFDGEIAAAAPATVGPLVRKWALEVIPGDELDRVDVLLRAERQAAGLGTAAA
ncbi:hypothetical protein GCM10010232_56420 [Streptomyces amakusaensis]|uniref:Uncharacterized protein n=1 Tax=Streptomyces amakusaensis TaxID=67271 RepID=A0ABW0AN50_9ACTN